MARTRKRYSIKVPKNKPLPFSTGEIGSQGDRAVDDMVNRGKKLGFDF